MTKAEREQVRKLAVTLLDDDQGISNEAYMILRDMLARASAMDIIRLVEATDDRFYLTGSISLEDREDLCEDKVDVEQSKRKRWRFHWLDKKTNEGEGDTPEQALRALGYGNGAMDALDYYEEVK